MKAFTLLLLAALAVPAFGGELYRWVDDKGTVNYTPYPPPANIKKVETKRLGGNSAQPVEGSYSLQQATKNFPVTLYATDCGELCNNARAHLKKRGIPFAEKNPTDPKEIDEFKKQSGGGMEIPSRAISPATGTRPSIRPAIRARRFRARNRRQRRRRRKRNNFAVVTIGAALRRRFFVLIPVVYIGASA